MTTVRVAGMDTNRLLCGVVSLSDTNTMAKKYQGFVKRNDAYPGNCFNFNDIGRPLGPEATLVVHEGDHELVFTESDVKAILKELFDDWKMGVGREVVRQHAAKHGITL